MLIFCENEISSSQLNQKIYAKVSKNFQKNIVFSMYYVYFLELTSDLDKHEILIAKELLKSSIHNGEINESKYLLVTPRQGVESSWGSKAKDIFYACGLTKLQRIEQTKLYIFNDEIHEDLLLNPLFYSEFFDKMTETIFFSLKDYNFSPSNRDEVTFLDGDILSYIEKSNLDMGLALSNGEIQYLNKSFCSLNRRPTEVELMMFAQVNSEHCRHKIFNSTWLIDGEKKEKSLFQHIKSTEPENSQYVIKAYSDNSAVISSFRTNKLFINKANDYEYKDTDTHSLIKVETHNHPTAISPFSGAATGSGGEIRDEAATGRGSKTKAGLCGFHVSNLNIPDFIQSWEENESLPYPKRIASALEIMIDGPLGSAAYNNEFGRPCLTGYFRTFEKRIDKNSAYGFHKPIMIAGGIGAIDSSNYKKKDIEDSDLIIVLGGPSMLIGLGGGAASSKHSSSENEDLDFASVQRENAEMERRCQEVIDRCSNFEKNIIVSIHDVGAGGLSNAVPEIVNDSKKGAIIDLNKIPKADKSMNPMELWCNESQERYVLCIKKESQRLFQTICEKENCPFSVIGFATNDYNFILKEDEKLHINIPMNLLFGEKEEQIISVASSEINESKINYSSFDFYDCLKKVLSLPAVASKQFLITIGDRSVGGLTVQDQFIGPWQVPVADCAITANDFSFNCGEAMSMGEKASIAPYNPVASAEMAVCEALLNICGAEIGDLQKISLSANWMSSFENDFDKYYLYKMAESITKNICKELSITIPVGKDSLSMKTSWLEDDKIINVKSPNTLVISAFSSVNSLDNYLKPMFVNDLESSIILVDLSNAKMRMGGSALSQVLKTNDTECPKVESIAIFKDFFDIIQELIKEEKILAYHDRSDGGLITTICEQCFSGHIGIDIELNQDLEKMNNYMFNEELGAVIQVKNELLKEVISRFSNKQIESNIIGKLNKSYELKIVNNKELFFKDSIENLHKIWHRTSYEIQKIRDNKATSEEEYNSIGLRENQGLYISKKYNDIKKSDNLFNIQKNKPRIGILREQGVNGHYEMANSFNIVGFESVDVTMNSLIENQNALSSFNGIVFCGGFSYGDVLGAGRGWANKILHNKKLFDEFSMYFDNSDKFALGVCNGCQTLSNLYSIIPGSDNWPFFLQNMSERFESRIVMVNIEKSNSIFTTDMEGSKIPIVISHGEGRANIDIKGYESLRKNNQIIMSYIDDDGNLTDKYPLNPNGSFKAIAGVSSLNGNVTLMMPHPERLSNICQFPLNNKGKTSPWLKFFYNARMHLK